MQETTQIDDKDIPKDLPKELTESQKRELEFYKSHQDFMDAKLKFWDTKCRLEEISVKRYALQVQMANLKRPPIPQDEGKEVKK
jgi:hypothetical protein